MAGRVLLIDVLCGYDTAHLNAIISLPLVLSPLQSVLLYLPYILGSHIVSFLTSSFSYCLNHVSFLLSSSHPCHLLLHQCIKNFLFTVLMETGTSRLLLMKVFDSVILNTVA